VGRLATEVGAPPNEHGPPGFRDCPTNARPSHWFGRRRACRTVWRWASSLRDSTHPTVYSLCRYVGWVERSEAQRVRR